MQSSNSVQSTLILVLLISAALLVRKGRLDPAARDLPKRQRLRPLPLEWLDPVIALVIAGPLLWDHVQKGALYVALGVLGGVVGVGIGLLRANVMFVRAVTSSRAVILTRSTAEYLLLALLIVLRLTEDAVDRVHSTPFALALTALLALAVVESITRSVGISLKYRSSSLEQRGEGQPG
jgi:hypothetical protein